MKAWTTFKIAKTCGYCGAPIPIGTRAQTIHLPGVTRVYIRCETCANLTATQNANAVTTPEPDPAA